MSAVASLYNVPTDDAERVAWSFAHMAHHRDINRAIYELVKIALPEYLIDPININDTGNWQYLHQLMHFNQDALLGISGYDLLEVDWKDLGSLQGWIYLNAQEHYQAAQILGIG